MSNTNTGGPAFPIPLQSGQSWQGMAPCDGMTLRDHFAAKAMQALIKSYRSGEPWPFGIDPEACMDDEDEATDVCATAAYWFADSMLKARDA